MINRIKVVREFSINMMKAAVGIATGKTQKLEAREKLRRLNICKSCPTNDFIPETMQCKVCTCRGQMLQLKASVNLWTCTKGHWDNMIKRTVDAPLGYCPSCKAVIESIDAKGMAKCINGHLRKVSFK